MSGMSSKTEVAFEKLEALRSEYKKLGDKVSRAYKKWEKLAEQDNKAKSKDVKWLIQGVDQPGHYESLRGYFAENYGGEYEGVNPSGYTHDGNYKNQEQNFDLRLETYGKPERKESYKKNVERFLSEFFPLLTARTTVCSRYNDKFPEMLVKPLQYKSEESGLSYLFFEPDSGNWYAGNLVYGRWDVNRKFKNFEEAFEFAFEESNKEESVWD